MYKLSATFLLLTVLCFPHVVEAHFGGMPIFKINGVFALPDIFDNTLEYAELRDRAPKENYPIGSVMEYEIDTTYIPASENTLQKTLFIWDFGDGSANEQGTYMLKRSHAYPEEGIYTVKVSIDTTAAGFPDEPQVIQVVPIVIGKPEIPARESKSYLVPEASEEYRSDSKALAINVSIGLFVISILAFFLSKRK